MSPMKTIDLKPKEFVNLDPAEFMKSFEKNRAKYRSFGIIAPKLGSSGFGKIRVKLKVPIYEIEGLDA